ncbi:MAG TPA: hypothetical protein VGW38_09010, partial [Chloroflexota bacterium]|nr:hypothetical protein [Chloroflexota bacterium]
MEQAFLTPAAAARASMDAADSPLAADGRHGLDDCRNSGLEGGMAQDENEAELSGTPQRGPKPSPTSIGN